MSPNSDCCMHRGPNAFVSFTPVQFCTGAGGANRSSPTGGAANGIPLNARTPLAPAPVPSIVPFAVFTRSGAAFSIIAANPNIKIRFIKNPRFAPIVTQAHGLRGPPRRRKSRPGSAGRSREGSENPRFAPSYNNAYHLSWFEPGTCLPPDTPSILHGAPLVAPHFHLLGCQHAGQVDFVPSKDPLAIPPPSDPLS